jgi:hypothetical protein
LTAEVEAVILTAISGVDMKLVLPVCCGPERFTLKTAPRREGGDKILGIQL